MNQPQKVCIYFQYSSLGLVLLVRLTISATPDTTADTLAKVALARGASNTPAQSGVFQGLLQYVQGSRLVMDMKK